MVDSAKLREYLVSHRRAIGWTQEHLAERSNVSVRTIRNLEAGAINNPRRGSVELLLNALDSALSAPGANQPPTGATSPLRQSRVASIIGADRTGNDTGGQRQRWLGLRPDPEPIVGRGADLEHILGAVQRLRRVVLTGPGGVGKTRLALTAADRIRARFRDGVAFVELGLLAPESVPPHPRSMDDFDRVRLAVLTAAGLPTSPTDPSVAGPPSADARMLIVIDNAEHVLKTVTRLSQQLLDDYRGLHLIITSRRSLPAASAHSWEVGPLGFDRPVNGANGRSDAVELFLRRVQSSCPTLDLSDRLTAVAELCRRLDGMPLAIEMAALRMRSVSLDTLLSDAPISHVLGQSAPAGLPHQRTLLESVRWSYDLLSEGQRRLLHQIAHRSGPFTFDDIARLGQRAETTQMSFIGLLSGLIDSSLVQVRRGPQYKYRVLGFVREFVNGLSAGVQHAEMPHPS
jgi:predicted ATPase